MSWQFNVSALQEQIQKGLPGQAAHARMLPQGRSLDTTIPEHALHSAVMITLFQQDAEWHTLLIRRTSDGHVHSGQISFPGGKRDKQDPNLLYTAQRECLEEVGLTIQEDQIIGPLSSVYIPPSNFLVTPYLACIPSPSMLSPSIHEVAEIIRLPLSQLFATSARKVAEVIPSSSPQSSLQAPVYAPNPNLTIWGATAMMLAELEYLLEQVTNPLP